ncbi:MAG TPA: phosphonate metabolism protein/1,5-bisphosphokinase (PRPP-forming) PhnN [Acetobacteraceae bacterium]|nr:phosphonate metabolism protein/1,5-bisphosphokinase (PRPP-forming) PhnN [Acetobacteraceae bacterium]
MLVLIVGPTGAGKDTLLKAARRVLGSDRRFRFVQRTITRPPDPKGEEYESVDEKTFVARREAGVFALAWRRNGCHYGIPADIGIDVAQGRIAVANVSRTLVGDAALAYPVRVIEVTAPPDLLARRLAAQGRLDAVGAASRLARAVRLPDGLLSETIVNDGTIEQGTRRLVAALLRAAGQAPALSSRAMIDPAPSVVALPAFSRPAEAALS